jgi:hypothetical protein
VRWISAIVGGRALSSILRVSFFVFRVKICRGGAQIVVTAPRAIRSPQLQPHLGGNVDRLMGVVLSSTISSGCGNLWIVKKLYRQFFILLRLRDGYGLLDLFGEFLSATNNVRSTQGGTAATAHRRHGLEVEDEGLLKNLVVIFVFLRCFVLFVVRCFFYVRVLFTKKLRQRTRCVSPCLCLGLKECVYITGSCSKQLLRGMGPCVL